MTEMYYQPAVFLSKWQHALAFCAFCSYTGERVADKAT